MNQHTRRHQPEAWDDFRAPAKHIWAVPFYFTEWCFAWLAYFLSNWGFLHVVNYLRTFGILVAVAFYFSEAGDRVKQKHYQAWQVINTAQGKGGNGGRLDALEELNDDRVPLVGVDVSGAFLQGLHLEKADLTRANFNAADVRNAILPAIDLSDADLRSANLRECNCRSAVFRGANLDEADFSGADLSGVDFTGATLVNADLRNADLRGANWRRIRTIKGVNLAGVKNAPDGFLPWAMKNGATESASDSR